VGYWSFDEGAGTTARDLSGRGNTGSLHLGTLGNTSSAAAWVPGRVANALSFDGSDDHVRVPHSASLQVSSANITVEAWINLARLGRHGAIVGSWQPWFFEIHLQNRMMFYIHDAPPGDYHVLANTALSANRWYHVVAVYTHADHRVHFFLNGVADGSPALRAPMIGQNHGLEIGSIVGGGWRQFSGLIDEVRIHNRALTEAEIRTIFNATR